MLEKKEHIDELFATYLSNYEEKVPNYVWQNVQADLKMAKIKKRNFVLRALAASIALFLTFGLGYYSSDLRQEQKFTKQNSDYRTDLQSNTVKIDKKDNKKLSDNQLSENIGINNKENIKNSESTAIENDGTNYGMLYKLFYLSKDDFFKSANKKNSIKNSKNKDQNYRRETTNQLLIDTLLFKKEDLSKRGLLLAENKKSRWSIGTKFSPVYSLAENQKPINDNQAQLKSAKADNTPSTKADEKSLMSFTGGLNVNYHFARRWSIESGVFYSEDRQMADNLVGGSIQGLQDEMMVYTPEGIRYIQPTGINNVNPTQVLGSNQDETYYSLNMDYISNFEYIELPLIVRYKIIDQKFGLDVLSGFSTNFLVGNKSTLMYNNNDLWSGASEGISPMLYNATVGLGLNYNLFQNFTLNLEPTFKYSINPSQTTLLKYPYSFAVFAGFSFRF